MRYPNRVRTSLLVLGILPCLLACTSAPTEAPRPPLPTAARSIDIGNISASPWSFDPSSGQETEITYTLSADAQVQVVVHGPNHEQIATLTVEEHRQAGLNHETWDGRGDDGIIVPDEGYYFTIEARGENGFGRYDPVSNSGGERVNPYDIHFNSRDGIITYILPKASRVLVRAGLVEGPLLTTLVNWRPRGPGLSTEQWKGRDQQGVRPFSRDPRALVVVQAYALPENAIITVGNRDLSYREYFLSGQRHRSVRSLADRESWRDDVASPHWSQPVHLDKDPEISIEFLGQEGDQNSVDVEEPVELVGDEVIVRVEVPDPHSRRFLLDQRFELVVFLDDERIEEAEQARLPFNWSWDISELEPGEHWLTINLVTFRQHVGASTRRVRIVREQ